jgi:hypothetical protein
MGIERRKKERFESQLFVDLENPGLKESLGRGVIIDLSRSGLAIETEVDLNTLQDVVCHIEIPISLKATVVRQVRGGQLKKYGLKIRYQSLMDRLVIGRIIKGRLKTRKV